MGAVTGIGLINGKKMTFSGRDHAKGNNKYCTVIEVVIRFVGFLTAKQTPSSAG
jgi:hypothetical protein